MGLKYGCPVEDIITGLSIQCRGWKSIFFNPQRMAFLGVATTTLDQTLVQHKRWSEGDLQIFLSKFNPSSYGYGKMNFGLIMGYLAYCFWSVNCFATLYYSIIPPLYLLKGVSLFPQVSSLWFLPFAYVIAAEHVYSFFEYLWSGGTALGYSNSGFIILAKVSDEDVLVRYEQEKTEFGAVRPMFTLLSSLAMLNLFCLTGMVMKVMWIGGVESFGQTFALQIVLCRVLVLINLPLYDAGGYLAL